jgi:Uma2 family endonuclease
MHSGQIDLAGLELPIVLRPSARVSDEELMRFSAQNGPYKIERNNEGDLTIMTPVGGIGSTHERYIIRMLGNWTEEDGTGIDFSPSVGFNLPDGSCLSPDASWMTLERWNSLTLKQQTGFPPLCPDFVIEVRSHSDSRRTLEIKMLTWLANGAKLAWLVDPVDGNVAIYRPHLVPETLDHPRAVQGAGPVAGFELHCDRLWAPRGSR